MKRKGTQKRRIGERKGELAVIYKVSVGTRQATARREKRETGDRWCCTVVGKRRTEVVVVVRGSCGGGESTRGAEKRGERWKRLGISFDFHPNLGVF